MRRRYRLAWCFAALLTVGLFCRLSARGDDQTKKEASDDQQEKVYELSDDITPPRLIRRVNPEYAPGSRGVRLEGSVIIETVVTRQGIPRDPRVLKGLEKEVDRAALEAVRQWRFSPATHDEKPVAVRVTIEIAFHPM